MQKVSVTRRANRIVGQLKGIVKMVDENRPVVDILQQIAAVKSAINGLTKEVIIDDLYIIAQSDDERTLRNIIDKLI